MISPQRTPKHYVLSSGKLSQKEHSSNTPTPKTIHYTHTVRMISPFECDHDSPISEINQRHKSEIEQKNSEINKLKKLVQQKQSLLMDKENLILKMRQQDKKATVKSQKTHFRNQNSRTALKDNINFNNHAVWTTVPNKQPQYIFPDVQYLVQPNYKLKADQQVLKVKEELKNTFDALSNITNLLQKPRRKYNFYFEDFQTNEIKKQAVGSQKRLSQTGINHFQNDSLNQTFIQLVQNEEPYLDQLQSVDLDPDQTSADDSPDTAAFLQDVINQHKILRQNLLDLEQSTNKQIQDLKDYYEKQIRMYIELLNSEKMQHQRFKIDSARTNFSNEENKAWDYYSNYEQHPSESLQKDIQDKPIYDQRQYPPDQ